MGNRKVVVTVSILLALLVISTGSSEQDLRINQETEIFREFLTQRLASEHGSDASTGMENPGSHEDHSLDDNMEQDGPGFDAEVEKLAANDPNDREKASTNEEDSSDLLRPHHYEEMLFVRRADSETNDPIVEVVDRFLHQTPDVRVPERHVPDVPGVPERHVPDVPGVPERHVPGVPGFPDVPERHQRAVFLAEEWTPDGPCPVQAKVSSSPNRLLTCPTSAEYEIRLHPNYSEDLNRQMKSLLPDRENRSREDSKCNFRRQLGPETGLEDRAVCPFEWKVL